MSAGINTDICDKMNCPYYTGMTAKETDCKRDKRQCRNGDSIPKDCLYRAIQLTADNKGYVIGVDFGYGKWIEE